MQQVVHRGQHPYMHASQEVRYAGGTVKNALDALIAGNLPIYSITDPAVDAAVTTAIVDNYAGVLITTTSAGNSQTIADPTVTTMYRKFCVSNNNTSTDSIVVNGITLIPGSLLTFFWDGDAWLEVPATAAVDVSFVPYGNISAVNVQAALQEVDDYAQNLADTKVDKTVLVDYTNPTGFVDITETTIAFNNSSPDRTFTIDKTGASYDVYVLGTEYVKTSAETIQISADEGMHFIYYDNTGTLQTTTTFTTAIITHNAIVAVVYWDATNNLGTLFDERHGVSMSGATHLYIHQNFGMTWHDGLALGDFTIAATGNDNVNAQFSTAAGEVDDEDVHHNTNAVAVGTGLEIWYLDGSNWRKTTNAGYSVLVDGGTGRLAFNDSGSQTAAGNNNFVLAHVFAWNGTNGDPIAIQGQAEYSTVSQAREAAESEIAALVLDGLPSPEMKAIGTVIFQTSNGYSNAVKARVRTTDSGDNYVDFRTSAAGTGAPATDHGALAGLSDDDHTQYALLAGRSGGQTLIGGIDASDNLYLTSSAHATKGKIYFGANSAYDELNDRLGVGTDSPSVDGHFYNAATATNVRIESGGSTTNSSFRLARDAGGGDDQEWNFQLQGDAGGNKDRFVIKDVTGSKEPFQILIGAESLGLSLEPNEVVINQNGTAGLDFRVEGNGAPNALFVQGSDGFVGVGTNTPSVELDVEGKFALKGSSSTQFVVFNAGDHIVFILDTDNSIFTSFARFNNMVDHNSAFVVGQSDGSVLMKIDTNTPEVVFNGANKDLDVVWNKLTSGEIMRVDCANGRLGVGTAIPDGAVHIDQADALALHVEDSGTKDDVFVVDTVTGNVGIGSSPTYLFHVQANVAGITDLFVIANNRTPAAGVGGGFVIEGQGNYRMAAMHGVWENAGSTAYLALSVQDGGLVEKMRITGAGRVGIHSTAPDAILHVDESDALAFLVEDKGVKDDVFVVDTVNGRVGVNKIPTKPFDVVGETSIVNTGPGAKAMTLVANDTHPQTTGVSLLFQAIKTGPEDYTGDLAALHGQAIISVTSTDASGYCEAASCSVRLVGTSGTTDFASGVWTVYNGNFAALGNTRTWDFNTPTSVYRSSGVSSNTGGGVLTMTDFRHFDIHDSAAGTLAIQTGIYIDKLDYASTNYAFYYNSTLPTVIDEEGNVGIGTDSPQTMLHLRSGASSAAIFMQDVSNSTNWFMGAGGGGFQFYKSNASADKIKGYINLWNTYMAFNEDMANIDTQIYDDAGVLAHFDADDRRVGIGTATPGTQLEMTGILNISADSTAPGIDTSRGYVWQDAASGLNFRGASGSSYDIMFEDSNGNPFFYGTATAAFIGTNAGLTTIESSAVVDRTNTEAFLVRKNADAGDVFVVDTTNARVGVNIAPTVDFHVNGVTRLGDASNYANFAADGYMTFVGTARVMKHLTIGSGNLGKGGTVPAQIIIGNFTGWEYDIGDDSVLNIDLPHDVDLTEDIELHIGWYIDEPYATNSGEIQWRAAWSACPKDNSEPIDAPTHTGSEDSGDINIPANAKYLQHTTILTLAAGTISDLDSIGITLSRIAVNDGSNPTADPVITEVHLEYTADKLGTAL